MHAPLPTRPQSTLTFGPYVLDPSEARLTHEGQPLALVGRAFDLLCALVERRHRLVEKDELLDAVWGHRHVTESSLKGTINTLRLALGDDAKAPLFIETVPRRGYRFIAEVQEVQAQAHARRLDATPTRQATEPSGIAPPNASPAAPGAAAALTSGNLPPEHEALIGRDAEMATLGKLLQAHRLVTLTGLGGVGKTRLAISAAHQCADAAWLLRLDELTDPSLLLPALARLMQLAPESAASPRALGHALSRVQCLLVLDNAEHLLEPVAQLCSALLDEAPRLRLLVTSQAPLRLRSEAVLPLEPLGLPAVDAGAAPDPDSYDAARLLTARIRHHLPGWSPGPVDAAPLAALCRALDGVPLALELAAARVPLLGLSGVCDRLDQRFALLTRGHREASNRHRTLAAALDWTVGLLSELERAALQQLAVFPGSVSLDACEGLLGPDALDLVEELRARSLLVVVHAPRGLRLRMFESVRSHALSALQAAGRESDARLAQLRWLADRIKDLWLTDVIGAQESWLPAMLDELDNLRAALRYGLGDEAPDAVRSVACLVAANASPLWQRAGALLEGWRWIRQAWTLAQSPLPGLDADTPLRLTLAWVDYCACTMQGDPREAVASIPPLLADPRIQADPLLRFLTLRAEFWLHVRLGFADPKNGPRLACDAFKQACLPLWPELTQRWWLRAESNVSRLAGDYEGALYWVERHTELCRRHGALANTRGLLYLPLQMLGLLDRWGEACTQAREQVAELQQAGLAQVFPFNMATAAAVMMRNGMIDADRKIIVQALSMLCDAQLLWWLADSLPWVAWHTGRPQDALAVQRWSDGLVHQRGERRGPFFGGMRQTLMNLLEQAIGPIAEPDPASLLAAAAMPEAQVLVLALGPVMAKEVLPD